VIILFVIIIVVVVVAENFFNSIFNKHEYDKCTRKFVCTKTLCFESR